MMTGPPQKKNSQPRSYEVSIPEGELDFSFARSGGPGGQNVNKVETKVTVTFNFSTSQALSWEQKGRLGRHPLIQQHLNSDGAIAISSQAHRSQALNREEAVRKLHDVIRQALRPQRKRIPTQKTKASERRRLTTKKFRSDTKVTRRSVRSYTEE